MPPGAPDLLLAYYGDDFTGSTDVLESLVLAGLAPMLFLEAPSPEELARHPGLRAVGVAGVSRSKSPEWMDEHLPPAFRSLQRLGARICHYKTCSTFDSAPHVGSIGRAIEIGQDIFGTATVPVVVGVPSHGRYVVFGNLFATAGDEVARIDRHPVMSRHPTTPMDEADLPLHLARQTARPIARMDFRALLREDAPARFAALGRAARIVILDGFDEATGAAAGRLIMSAAASGPVFVAGSSGVGYGLAAALRATGPLGASPPLPAAGPVDRLLVVSGSASPTTAAQIRWAEANGFASIPLDGPAMVAGDRQDGAVRAAVAALRARRSAVLHTAVGPDDPRIGATRQALAAAGLPATDSAELLGSQLGRLIGAVLAETDLRRVVIAGGDSCGYACTALGITALEMVAPLVPGSPLCRVQAHEPRLDGLEMVLKGGQIGGPDYFAVVKQGSAPGRGEQLGRKSA